VTDDYRYTGTLFKRSPLVSPTGEGFAAKVRAIVADHAWQLQGMMSQAKRGQGLYRNGMAGKKRTWLPGGILVETWINPFGLAPTIMARVVFPKVEAEEEEVFSFMFENGALILVANMPDTAAPPLNVYFGSALAAYFAGDGTQAKTHDGFWHLQGKIEYTPDDFLDKTGSLPESSPYASAIYKQEETQERIVKLFTQLNIERRILYKAATPPITQSSIWSGLMRLAVQTWIGVGRSPGPATYITNEGAEFAEAIEYPSPHAAPNPYTDGLIHDAEYNFWWVRIAGTTASFRALIPTKQPSIFAQSILAAGGLSEEQEKRYLLALLMWLSPDADKPEIVIELDAAEEAIGGGRIAPGYGWKFNRGDQWKAAIVTHREGPDAAADNWYMEATLAEIEFSFIDGQPTATLSIIEADKEWANALFWVQTAAGTCNLVAITKPSAWIYKTVTSDAPMYCYYEGSDLRVLRFAPIVESTQTTAGANSSTPCGIGTEIVFDYFTANYNVKTGGYSMSGVASQAEALHNGFNQRVTGRRWNELSGFEITTTITTTPTDADTALSCDNINGAWSDSYPTGVYRWPAGVTQRYGGMKYTQYQFFQESTSHRFALIPEGDAEAVIFGKTISSDQFSRTQIEGTFTENGVLWQRVIPAYEEFIDGVWEAPVAINRVEDRAYINQFTHPSTSVSTNLPAITVKTGGITLATSRGVFECDPPDGENVWWNCVYAPSDCCCCSANISFAYTNGGLYSKDGRLEGYVGVDGYPDELEYLNVRWIGDA
jgi:hypothetical protein